MRSKDIVVRTDRGYSAQIGLVETIKCDVGHVNLVFV